MQLRYENKKMKVNENTEFPDFSFDFAYSGVGSDEITVTYLVPSDDESTVKAQAGELAAHLMGRYR